MFATATVVDRLKQPFDALNEELLAFVKTCSDADWHKVTASEGWTVGVTARHIAVAHYPVIEWVKLIVQGDPLPPVTMETVNQLNAQHAAEHGDCTQQEVADLLVANHAKVIAYLQTINDEALASQGYIKLFDTDISAAQLFQAVLIDIAARHFASIQETVQP